MFFELRQYRVKVGQREKFVRWMEEEIIPFQISKGMVVVGSFVGQEEEDLFVWIRRFESDEERDRQGKEVYGSAYWQNEVNPKIDEFLVREKMVVTRLEATPKSVIQ